MSWALNAICICLGFQFCFPPWLWEIVVGHMCYWGRNPVRLRGTALWCSPLCWGSGPWSCTQQAVHSHQMKSRGAHPKEFLLPYAVCLVRNESGGIGELRDDSHKGKVCLELNACLREEWGHAPHPFMPLWWGNTSKALDHSLPYLPAAMVARSQQWIIRLQQEGGEILPGMPFTDRHRQPAPPSCKFLQFNEQEKSDFDTHLICCVTGPLQ